MIPCNPWPNSQIEPHPTPCGHASPVGRCWIQTWLEKCIDATDISLGVYKCIPTIA